MASSTCRRVLTGLAAGVLCGSSVQALCESGASGEACPGARPARRAQDHLLIQVARNRTERGGEERRGGGGGGGGGEEEDEEEEEEQERRTRGGRGAAGSGCSFAVLPHTPFYWEPNCSMGVLGCWADGVHAECRFCDYEYIRCPRYAWRPIRDRCDFDNEPLPADVGYYYERDCPDVDNGLGCNADGKHVGCRLCGGGAYASVPCKVDQCTFANEPTIPYYFDHDCKMGDLGCMADGIHLGCRFCAKRPFDSVPCPASTAIPAAQCWFRNEPNISYYWDANCTMGEVGCWADGIHAECRFCNGTQGSAYEAVACP